MSSQVQVQAQAQTQPYDKTVIVQKIKNFLDLINGVEKKKKIQPHNRIV